MLTSYFQLFLARNFNGGPETNLNGKMAVLAWPRAGVWAAAALIAWAVTVTDAQGVATPTAWSRVASPTTQDLNAVAAAPSGSYVAVGNGGTLLESSDGVRWLAGTSGTSQNLYAVISPGGINNTPLWVAVGAAGTVLTSPDGIAWTTRASGTNAELRGVAYSSDYSSFLAVGSGGTAVVSSDGIAWAVVQLKTTASLNAVVAVPKPFRGGDYFLIVGANGTVIADEAPSSAVAPLASGTTTNFLAAVVVAAPYGGSGPEFLSDSALALGQQGVTGTYSYVLGDIPFPVWGLNPTIIAATYAAAASAIINNAWYGGALTTDGVVMALPSAEVSSSAAIQLPSGTQYTGIALGSAAVVVGERGTIWTNSAAVGGLAPTVALAGSAVPAVPFIGQTMTLSVPPVAGATYQWFQNGDPIAGGTNATLVLTNIQLSATGTYSVAVDAPTMAELPSTNLNVKPFPDYSPALVDLGFVSSVAAPNSVTPLPNGDVVADGTQLLDPHGNLVATTGFYEADQVIAQPDGKWIDVGVAGSNETPGIVRYNADGSADSSFSVPSSLFDFFNRLVLMPNGQFLLLTTPAGGQNVVWRRLNSTGSLDASFSPQSVSVANAEGVAACSVDPQGRVYVAVLSANNTANADTVMFRLAANLAVDPSFSTGTSRFAQTSVTQLQATPQGVLYAALSGQTTRVGLLDANGTPDPGYAAQQIFDSPCALQPDGTVIALIGSVSATSVLCGNLVRFTSAGQFDPNYGGRLVGDPSSGMNNSPYGLSSIKLTALANGQLLVSGSFNSLNFTPTKNLARIIPDTDYAATRLVNASARGTVTSAQPLVMAGYINGSGAQASGSIPFLFRAAGPILGSFGVSNAIANPSLRVQSSQGVIGTNSGWSASGQASAIASVEAAVGAFPFAPNFNDAAWTGSVGTGPFFLQVTDGNGTGVTLAEAYDAGSAPATASDLRITNVSCLDATTPGNGQLTLGFVVAGADVKTFLIRAVGPGLSAVNVTGPGILAAPILTLYQGQNAIAANQNINTLLYDGEAYTDATLVGAFQLPLQSPDSVLVVALPHGAYTAVASGTNGTSGTVLLEVYEVP